MFIRTLQVRHYKMRSILYIKRARSYIRWLLDDIRPCWRITIYFKFILVFCHKIFLGKKEQSDWIIGEARGECNKDNGYYFFNFCNGEVNRSNVYFVISKFSPYYEEMKHNPYVLRYGSMRHIFHYINSKVCFYTHTQSDFILREIFNLFHNKRKTVFLHHGVLGFKEFDSRYKKSCNKMDLFTVGNNIEYKILTDEIGVDEDRVAVTGYARYDYLFDASNLEHLQICYMPTHRDWLRIESANFRESEFYRSIQTFLLSDSLHAFLRNANITLKFKLHEAMRKYQDHFAAHASYIDIVRVGTESTLDLIRNSHLLITDYSSVAWDFFYLGKPVLFYNFDVTTYISQRGSYISVQEPLLGDIYYDAELLINAIKSSYENRFRMEENYSSYRDAILPNIDSNNSKRILHAVSRMFD